MRVSRYSVKRIIKSQSRARQRNYTGLYVKKINDYIIFNKM